MSSSLSRASECGQVEAGGFSRALHRFAVVTAALSFVLVFVGGLVTSTGSALAIPDWPLAFGTLIPELSEGVRVEYGHRVLAGVVGILTLALAIWAWREQRRSPVSYTAWAAFALVVAQAVLGGVTVLLELPLAMAVAHAATGQAFFCLAVCLALMTNPAWQRLARLEADPSRLPLPLLGAITTAVIFAQTLLGAVMRHMSAGLVIPDFPAAFGKAIPPFWNGEIAVNFAHRCGAVLAMGFVLWAVARVLTRYRNEPLLRRPALGLFLLLAAQISLGAITVWSEREVLPTTAHVAVGAALLATSLVLTIRAYHMIGPVKAPSRELGPLPPTCAGEPRVFA